MLTRGNIKLMAFLIGFPLFVATFGQAMGAGEAGDMEEFYFWGSFALLGLIMWLWGVFSP